ncbi:MAG TPA: exodeoxyribonuclease VII small subunit [Bacteroidota bacterium]|nr:exodeoxyribonuclease VII small subunit [Bacteroidota bacterium]
MPTKKKDAAPTSLEDAIRRLELIVQKLEQGDVPLEQAMDLYEEGIAVSRLCTERLTRAELTLKRLSKDAEGRFSLQDEEE